MGFRYLFCLITIFFLTGPGILSADTPFQEGLPPDLEYLRAQAKSSNYPNFSALVKHLRTSVVSIAVEAELEDERDNTPPFMKRDPAPARSLGSGVVISEDGYIITNNHVIDKAKKIDIRLIDDKTSYTAAVRGIDERTDLALIQLTCAPQQSSCPPKLEPVYLGDSDEIEVGDWVLAIGNQFQLGQTVTAGIVSAKARRVPSTSVYDAFIQTDASINPGSSGGPLVNNLGQVVGINTAIFSPGRTQLGGTGFNIGIGFSIPINTVKRIITQLKQSKKVVRGLLGVQIQGIDRDLAEALNLKTMTGALVAEVIKDTPAEAAGIRIKDVIVGFDGKTVQDHEDLPSMVANTEIGKEVGVKIIRENKFMELSAKIAELKDRADPKKKPEFKADEFGFILEDLSPEMGRSLGLSLTEGVIVQAIEPGSVADLSGFGRGDVLVEVAGQRTPNLETLRKVFQNILAKTVLVVVRRGENTRLLTLKRK